MNAKTLYESLSHIKVGGTTCVYTPEKCAELVPIINEINALKKEKNAVILSHSYVSPEILFSVTDFMGDSYELSKKAKQVDAETIVFTAVKFMAETTKIINPEKKVLVPSLMNGCSLADSITAEDVRRLKKEFPDYTFVCYINTTAAVKAECDVCVTSSNVYQIVEKIPNNNIYFLPDRLMGKNILNYLKAKKSPKKFIFSDGSCYVHEEYDPDLIRFMKLEHKNLAVLSHPECHESVVAESDYVGSTSQMMNYVKQTDHEAYFMLTECGLTSRLQLEVPNKKFVGSCTMCKYMKSNTLSQIRDVLKSPKPQFTIEVDPLIRKKALNCINAMFEYAH